MKNDLIAFIEAQSNAQEALDGMVHDHYSSLASSINNQGPEEQVDHLLLNGYSLDQIRGILCK